MICSNCGREMEVDKVEHNLVTDDKGQEYLEGQVYSVCLCGRCEVMRYNEYINEEGDIVGVDLGTEVTAPGLGEQQQQVIVTVTSSDGVYCDYCSIDKLPVGYVEYNYSRFIWERDSMSPNLIFAEDREAYEYLKQEYQESDRDYFEYSYSGKFA